MIDLLAECFVGWFRSECLDAEVFEDLADARLKSAMWRSFYNEDRHGSPPVFVKPSNFRRKWE